MHLPVLQKEILDFFNPKPNENFIDCTIGEGGYAPAILKRTAPTGKILGIDWDKKQIENCQRRLKQFQKRLVLVVDNFANLKEIVKKTGFGLAAGILLDLGMSSWHLEKAGRGFTFLKDEPLDMRYSPDNDLKAEMIVNQWPEKEINRILKEYGEEKWSIKISREIIKVRKIKPIKSTQELVAIIKKAVPLKYQHQKLHFATKTFQALRIAVNRELENLEKVLPQTINVLKPGGRLAIISFHSLEDRIVKNFLKEKQKQNILKIVNKKPISPNLEEIKINPRSRSAKLRTAIICHTPINL
ncbi:MAG: 16S rRNA (cytosine(1402)-N(4))-methyltransferase RsmH [Minisyncoccales bacterium]